MLTDFLKRRQLNRQGQINVYFTNLVVIQIKCVQSICFMFSSQISFCCTFHPVLNPSTIYEINKADYRKHLPRCMMYSINKMHFPLLFLRRKIGQMKFRLYLAQMTQTSFTQRFFFFPAVKQRYQKTLANSLPQRRQHTNEQRQVLYYRHT